MRFWCATVLGCAVALGTVLPASAEEPPTASTSPAGPKKAAFDKLFKEWKDLLSRLYELKVQYVSADSAKKKTIRAEFEELVQKGEALEPKLRAAAEDAYKENPAGDKDLEQFLISVCRGSVLQDDYEKAFQAAELLIKNKVDDKDVWAAAGMAAFAIGELNKAQTYVQTARNKGAAIQTGNESFDARFAQFLDNPKIDQKAWAAEQKIRDAEAKAGDLPRVLLKTDKGDIEIELFENEAPQAVANFITLVEKGYYDGLSFHRVLPGFMAQGGCPKGDGTGGPGYSIRCECQQPNARKHFRGSLSMAHAGRDTGGSQFFLTFMPTSFLDGRHTVFGRVVKGMDVLAKIQRINPEEGPASQPRPDRIQKATVLRKRDHKYEFTKLPGK